MNYVKAADVLPSELIEEIQKYVQGGTIYIPKPEGSHQKWGTRSGARRSIAERNKRITQDFRKGMSIADLAEEYFLSIESIKKIVYSNNK